MAWAEKEMEMGIYGSRQLRMVEPAVRTESAAVRAVRADRAAKGAAESDRGGGAAFGQSGVRCVERGRGVSRGGDGSTHGSASPI